MIQLQEIIRSGAMFEKTQAMLIEPTCIESARPDEVPGFDGEACRLKILDEERPVFIVGTIEDLHQKIQGEEVLASERLAAIKGIVDGGT